MVMTEIPPPTMTPATTTPVDPDADLGCGCCVRPPAAAADKVAALDERRQRIERKLETLASR